jgi:hypothetical protein
VSQYGDLLKDFRATYIRVWIPGVPQRDEASIGTDLEALKDTETAASDGKSAHSATVTQSQQYRQSNVHTAAHEAQDPFPPADFFTHATAKR